jgi:hypothetical protein
MRLWECPRCGQQMLSPDTIYQAVCACLQYVRLTGRTTDITYMNDVTDRLAGQIRAVPDDLSELL